MRKSFKINENRKLITGLFILGFIFLLFAFKFATSELPEKDNVVKITDVLAHDIQIKRSKSSKTLILNLKKYPELNFQIGGSSLRQTIYEDLIHENKSGDTITIFVENAEYRSKILKKEKIPFPDNYLHADKINIVEIKSKNRKYLSLEEYIDDERQNNHLGAAFFGLAGLFLIFGGIVIFKKSKNNA